MARSSETPGRPSSESRGRCREEGAREQHLPHPALCRPFRSQLHLGQIDRLGTLDALFELEQRRVLALSGLQRESRAHILSGLVRNSLSRSTCEAQARDLRHTTIDRLRDALATIERDVRDALATIDCDALDAIEDVDTLRGLRQRQWRLAGLG
eukprot:scaffold64460_cov63-Phaeocystis_antarctica.AAC.1